MMRSSVAAVALIATCVAASAQDPEQVAFNKLPKDIRALHSCASAKDTLEITLDRFAKSVVFLVTCPSTPEDELMSVYVARDRKGTGARRVSFPVLGADGKEKSVEVIPSAASAREIRSNGTRNDPPWVTAAWEPKDRPGLCQIVAHWRLTDAQAELWRWSEASECPSDGTPKYVNKVDRKGPELVGQ